MNHQLKVICLTTMQELYWFGLTKHFRYFRLLEIYIYFTFDSLAEHFRNILTKFKTNSGNIPK